MKIPHAHTSGEEGNTGAKDGTLIVFGGLEDCCHGFCGEGS